MQDALAAAASAALRGLLDAQDCRGCWLDFPQVGNGSDEWVTGYIGAAVAVPAPAAAARAWASLTARRRWSGGWGFMPSYPADADSTVCALRLAEALSTRSTLRVRRARAFIARHQRATGGVSTYLWPQRMVWHTGLRDRFEGWCSTHVCVSANAAHLAQFAGRQRLLDFLCRAQQPDGSWRAYWWYDEHEYATALAVEALACSRQREHRGAVERAVDWARAASRVNAIAATPAAPDGSAFATALRLRVLSCGGDDEELAAMRGVIIKWLVATQRNNGLWAASAWLRFPSTEVVDTTTISEWHIGQMIRSGVMCDGRGLFTTATVLSALQAMLARRLRNYVGERLSTAASG